MSSFIHGKDQVCKWIRAHFPRDSSILDVGACDGAWQYRLQEYKNIDAVEAFEPNLKHLKHYRNVYHADIRGFEYENYDLIIFGDVVEHMSVGEAQAMLNYAWPRCKDMIVVVPFKFRQGMIYNNPYEIHVQDDLTDKLFNERYPGFEVLCRPIMNYCYYHKPGVFDNG